MNSGACSSDPSERAAVGSTNRAVPGNCWASTTRSMRRRRLEVRAIDEQHRPHADSGTGRWRCSDELDDVQVLLADLPVGEREQVDVALGARERIAGPSARTPPCSSASCPAGSPAAGARSRADRRRRCRGKPGADLRDDRHAERRPFGPGAAASRHHIRGVAGRQVEAGRRVGDRRHDLDVRWRRRGPGCAPRRTPGCAPSAAGSSFPRRCCRRRSPR